MIKIYSSEIGSVTLMEMALLLGLIAIVLITAIPSFRQGGSQVYSLDSSIVNSTGVLGSAGLTPVATPSP